MLSDLDMKQIAKQFLSVAFVISILLFPFSLIHAQAQTPQLPWPDVRNFDVYDDALHWDAIEHASGYRVRRLGISDRDRITVEVSQNRFDLSGLQYDYTYFTDIQAISGDPTLYADRIVLSVRSTT